jgi:hypothetical protein
MNRMKKTVGVFVVGLAASLAAHATVIDFTVAEGYADGNLDNKPSGGTYTWDVDWDASDWKVVNETAQITSGTANFRSARWTEAFSGANITQSASLTFTRTVETPAASKSLFFIGINELTVRGGKSALIGIRQLTGSDQYALFFFENVGTQDSTSSSTFSGADIGLTSGGVDTTDALTLNLTHTYNGSDSWTTIASLNDGETEVATLSRIWSADGGPAGWSDADKYLTLSAANIGENTGVIVNFDEVSIIPEPATLGMFGISSMGLLLGRRMLTM